MLTPGSPTRGSCQRRKGGPVCGPRGPTRSVVPAVCDAPQVFVFDAWSACSGLANAQLLGRSIARGNGAAQESNLPRRGLHARTGFEDSGCSVARSGLAALAGQRVGQSGQPPHRRRSAVTAPRASATRGYGFRVRRFQRGARGRPSPPRSSTQGAPKEHGRSRSRRGPSPPAGSTTSVATEHGKSAGCTKASGRHKRPNAGGQRPRLRARIR